MRRIVAPTGLCFALACITLTGVAALSVAPRPAHAQATLPAHFADELVVGGLSLPVGMAFLPDGRLLVVEQSTARVRVIVKGAVAAVDPALTVPGVNATGGERGLLGIAVDPGWPERPYVYIHATHVGSRIRISRFRAAGDLSFTGDGSITFDPASRYDLLDDLPDLADNHNGGTLRFGTNGQLYVSLGEDAVERAAQDTSSLRGVILRLDVSRLPDGPGTAARALITPPDNPFANTGGLNARLIWAWGLRNPFRFHIDPATGDLFIADVGQSTWEEIDWAPGPGMNFGWPRYEGPSDFDTSAPLVGPATGPIHFMNQNDFGVAAIISAGIYRRPAGATHPWPTTYEGDLFFNDYYAGILRRLKRSGSLWQIAPAESGQVSADNWATGLSRVSDWAIGPDGSMWYLRQYNGAFASTGQIRRIVVDSSWVAPPPPPEPVAVDFRPPYPAPASESVVFDFTLTQVARTRLTVYDMRGALVRQLWFDEATPIGLNRVVWDGLDDDGRLVRSGVYFAVLDVDGRTHARRIPIVR